MSNKTHGIPKKQVCKACRAVDLYQDTQYQLSVIKRYVTECIKCDTTQKLH